VSEHILLSVYLYIVRITQNYFEFLYRIGFSLFCGCLIDISRLPYTESRLWLRVSSLLGYVVETGMLFRRFGRSFCLHVQANPTSPDVISHKT